MHTETMVLNFLNVLRHHVYTKPSQAFLEDMQICLLAMEWKQKQTNTETVPPEENQKQTQPANVGLRQDELKKKKNSPVTTI